MIHAICEDYRAGASIDLEHDEADLDRKVSCPLLALWAEQGAFHRLFDALATWRERASDVSGRLIPGGIILPEEAPNALMDELRNFLVMLCVEGGSRPLDTPEHELNAV
mgnify:CR=1 FL=1